MPKNITNLKEISLDEQEKDRIIDRMLHTYFKEESDRAFLDQLVVKNEAELNALPVPRIVPLWQRTWVRAVAACLVLCSAAYYLYPRAKAATNTAKVATDTMTVQQLASYFLSKESPRGLVVTQMGVHEDIQSRIEGRTHFQDKQYEACIISLTQIEQKNANDVFLLAMANLYQSQPNYQQSSALLLQVRALKADYSTQEIHWYLALNYLKLDKKELAKAELLQMHGWHEAEKKALLERM
jgi:hypothetical protein